MKKWTIKEIDYLKKCYPNTEMQILVRELKRTRRSIQQKVYKERLFKDIDFIRDLNKKLIEKSEKYRFKKGVAVWNKGTKGVSVGGKQTQFKKGNIPKNIKELGTERINRDGYIEVKTDGVIKWKLKHRLIWEQNYGKIESGYNIQFKDGNYQNCNIENLYMISREKQILQNSILNLPLEIQIAYKSIGKINKLINKQKTNDK